MKPDMPAHLPKVTIIGLGAMGTRLARNLLADGYLVTVANRSTGPVAPLVRAGATAAASPAEAAADADVVLVAVADDAAAETVWLDRDTGILAGARFGTLGIDVSTLSPDRIRALADAADHAGMRFLEAPMIGSRPQVEGRALVHLVGGPLDTLVDARDVLHVSAARIHHVGDYGAASVLKLIVNGLLATQIATLAELVGLARRAGLDLTDVASVLTGLPVTSAVAARAINVMASEEYAPNFPVRLAAKDLRYLIDLAEQLAAHAPMARTALVGYEQTSAAGRGDDDLHAIATIR